MIATRLRTPPGLRSAERSTLPRDLLAGLTVWAVLVPEALAYATIAGVPPVVGLYAAPAALALYAVLGSSPSLVVGPMAATSALSAAAIAAQAPDPATAVVLTAGLAIAVGVVALAAGVLRLGFVASFVSEPVLKGFIIGLAATIIAGQLPKLIGLHSIHGNFLERMGELVTHLGDAHGASALVGACSLAALVGLERFVPRAPAPLLVVLAAILASKGLDLAGHDVAVVGPIASGLPEVGAPSLSWADYGALSSAAIGIALVGFAEGLAAAKSAAEPGVEIDPNRELVGLGAANVGAGLSSGMVVAGSLSKTAVARSAGSRSQVTGLVVAIATVLTLLFLTGLFRYLPEPTLAAVVIAAVVGLIDVRALRELARASSADLRRRYGPAGRSDLLAALAALVGVLLFDTLPGLFIGIGVSALLLVYRASRPNVAVLGRVPADGQWRDVRRHPEAASAPGVVVVRPESGLAYINADNVRAEVLAAIDDAPSPVHRLVIDASAVPTVDLTAATMLAHLDAEVAARGITLVVAGDVGQVRDLLRHSEASRLESAAASTIDDAVQGDDHG